MTPEPSATEQATAEGEARYQSVFRAHWRDRQSAASRPGELIKQPKWIDAGLVGLGLLLVAGGIAAGTITIARTESLPAAAQGTAITAIRFDGPAPETGTPAEFRDAYGRSRDAVVIGVTDTEVRALLLSPDSAPAGELVVPAGEQRLISVLLPRFW